MSLRYKEEFGLTDGEVLERLWSFLRLFLKMTKEILMRPSHRVDVLTDTLLHYCRLSSNNLSMFFVCSQVQARMYHFRIFAAVEKEKNNTGA